MENNLQDIQSRNNIKCIKCGDKNPGNFYDDDIKLGKIGREREKEIFCIKCRKERRRELLKVDPGKHLASIGVPPRFYDCTLENFKGGGEYIEKIHFYLKNLIYLKNLTEGLYIYGPYGCGKTHLAIGILKELRVNYAFNRPCEELKFITTPELLLELRGAATQKSTERTLILKYSRYDYLFLDDMGAEKTSDFSLSCLYQILNYRYNNLKPIIITSNLNLDELSKKLSSKDEDNPQRIASRIVGLCWQIQIKMPDYRIQQRKEMRKNKDAQG
ncbi:MAG: ATP-binding protein [Candidatus Ratteibacteria bacterium]|nr:ATP-binding protein [Candidatus Ratteibacteria bacterium]